MEKEKKELNEKMEKEKEDVMEENDVDNNESVDEKQSTGEEDKKQNEESDDKSVDSEKSQTEVNESQKKENSEDEDQEEKNPNKKLENLKEELDDIKKEKDGYYKQLVRLKSDFKNFRKRTQKEKEGLELKARVSIINELLPVLDNFERALASSEEESDFKEGVEMIYKQLLNVLKQEGLEVIPAEGEPFNHKYHEAIMRVEDSDEESGIIVEEVQKGYLLEGKVVRPSMVKVAE